MTDRMAIVMLVALWVIVIAVADMNWPQHMGPQNTLIDAIRNLI